MPISFSCPSCSARLSVPDAAAGKRVKCPKCQAAVAVADLGFEVLEPAAASPARPAKAVRVAEDGEDDRPVRRRPDDEEDCPLRKPAKRKERDFLSSPPVLIVGGLLGCAIAALFVYQVQKRIERDEERQAASGSGGRPASPGGPDAPPPLPSGWRAVSPPGTGVTVHAPIDLLRFDVPPQARKKGTTLDMWQGVHNGRTYQLIVVVPDQLPAGDLRTQLDELTWGMIEGSQLDRPASRIGVSVGGRPGRQLAFSQGDKNVVIRVTLVGTRVVAAAVYSAQPVDTADSEIASYLESLRIDS